MKTYRELINEEASPDAQNIFKQLAKKKKAPDGMVGLTTPDEQKFGKELDRAGYLEVMPGSSAKLMWAVPTRRGVQWLASKNIAWEYEE